MPKHRAVILAVVLLFILIVSLYSAYAKANNWVGFEDCDTNPSAEQRQTERDQMLPVCLPGRGRD